MGIDRIKHGIRTVVTLTLTAFLLTQSAWAWSRLGHRVSARMAEGRLTPKALAAVHYLLGHGISLADISTWADDQREVPGTETWHYLNVPIMAVRYDPEFCRRDNCIVSKIKDFRRVLQNPDAGKTEKQQALKFLVHLISDLHQPLHVGDTGSKGGKLIQVQFYGVDSNLHQAWDSLLMERYTNNEQIWLWETTSEAKAKMIQEWSKGILEDWATESLKMAQKAYCLPGKKIVMSSGTKLNDDYCRMALPIIQKQLAKAGIRIAWTLNELFK